MYCIDLLYLGRKAMTNLDNILKRRDITLPTKVRLIKATVFPVVMYGCESWTVKKAEHRRIEAFVLWCWRRLLRVPWTARRSNHSFQRNPRADIQNGLVGSPCSPRDSQESSPTSQFKSFNSSALGFLQFNSHIHT